MKVLTKIRGQEVEIGNVITPDVLGRLLKKGATKDYDFPLVITGKPRRGKSVLAIQIARAYDRHYTHEKNLIYSDKQFNDFIQNEKDKALIVDEAVKMFLASNATSGKTKQAIIALNVCGNQHNQIIFALPFLTDLVKSIREKRAQYWIYIIKRGLGVIFKSNDGLAFTENFWMAAELEKRLKIERQKRGEILGTLYACEQMPTFRNFIVWDDLDPKDYAMYNDIKDKKKYEEDDDSVLESSIVKEAKINLAVDILRSLRKSENYSAKAYIRKVRQTCSLILGISDNTLMGKLRLKESVLGEGKKEESGDLDFNDLILNENNHNPAEQKEEEEQEEIARAQVIKEEQDEFDFEEISKEEAKEQTENRLQFDLDLGGDDA